MKHLKTVLAIAIAVSCLMTGCSENSEQSAAAANNEDLTLANVAEITFDTPTAEDLAAVRETSINYEEQKSKYGEMLPGDYSEIPQDMTYGVMTEVSGLMVSHMKAVDDNGKPVVHTDSEGKMIATLDFLNLSSAEIVSENGAAASAEALTPGTAVLVQYEMRDETYPGNMHCTKIVIQG